MYVICKNFQYGTDGDVTKSSALWCLHRFEIISIVEHTMISGQIYPDTSFCHNLKLICSSSF